MGKIQLHDRSPRAGMARLGACELFSAAASRNGQRLAAALLARNAPGEALGVVLAGNGLRRGDGGLAHGCSDVDTLARLAASHK